MEYRKMGGLVYIRMDKGDEVIAGLRQACQELKIKSATFQGIGACDQVTVGTYLPAKQEFLQHECKTIQCPVLLMAGDEDDHAPMVTMVEAEQYIPNASICIVPKAWHSAFNDNFSVTWTAMQGFLQTDRSKLTGSKKVAYNRR